MRFTVFLAALIAIIGGSAGGGDGVWALIGAITMIYLFLDFAEQSQREAEEGIVTIEEEEEDQLINFETATFGPVFPETTKYLEDGHVHFLQEESQVNVFIWSTNDQVWELVADAQYYPEGERPHTIATIVE